MAFKKGGGGGGKGGKKQKKQKKKKSSGKKDGYTHEGGVSIDDDAGGAAAPGAGGATGEERRGPRRTQNRDENARRGKLKFAERKKAIDFKKKMSKKIKFSDVLREERAAADAAAAAAAAAADEEAAAIAAAAVKRPRVKSSRSVLDRLQGLISKNLTRSRGGDDDDDNDDDDDDVDNEVDDDDDEGVEEGDGDDDDDDNMDDDEDDDNEDDTDAAADDDDHGDDEGEEEEDDDDRPGTGGSDDFDWFFTESCGSADDGAAAAATAAPTKANKKQKGGTPSGGPKPLKMSKLTDLDGFQLFGGLHAAVAERRADVGLGPVRRLGDVPGAHKLLRSRRAEEVDGDLAPTLLQYLTTYADAMLEGRDHDNDDELLAATLIHVGNHVIKARAKVVKHNQKAKKRATEMASSAASAAAAAAESGKKKKKAAVDKEALLREAEAAAGERGGYADQGYCRPRVLILCPMRGTALRVVEGLVDVLGENTSLSSRDKFAEEFGPPDDDEDDEDEDDDEEDEEEEKGRAGGESLKRKRKQKKRRPPEHPDDWRALFKGQNVDDDFKVGVQINPGQGKGKGAGRGAYMRLFCDFYQSDVVIASPLGLRFLIETEGKLNADFLSSIELAVLHQADVMYMQNWEHVEFVMDHLNRLPEQDHGTDFSRVRPYFLEEGQAAAHRQLIVTTHFNEPALQASFRAHARSVAGCLRLKRRWGDGSIAHVGTRVKQVFQLIRAPSFDRQEEARWAYFVESVLGPMLRVQQSHTLIVTPSYFSFVRLRNELLRREANAVYVSEYSRDSEIARGRSNFFHGRADIMLYSGRAHFFRRYMLRGARHVVFYSLPEYAHFYPEIVNLIAEGEGADGGSTSCLTLCTQYEQMALERLVGAKRCEHMLKATKSTFMFC